MRSGFVICSYNFYGNLGNNAQGSLINFTSNVNYNVWYRIDRFFYTTGLYHYLSGGTIANGVTYRVIVCEVSE